MWGEFKDGHSDGLCHDHAQILPCSSCIRDDADFDRIFKVKEEPMYSIVVKRLLDCEVVNHTEKAANILEANKAARTLVDGQDSTILSDALIYETTTNKLVATIHNLHKD